MSQGNEGNKGNVENKAMSENKPKKKSRNENSITNNTENLKDDQNKKKYTLAVVGATGLVGSTIVKILEERQVPVEKMYFFSSIRSAGKVISFQGKDYVTEELTKDSFNREIDFALFAAGGAISEEYGALAASRGITVIDNSSVFRMKDNVPLVVPEVNLDAVQGKHQIIANPNCTTIQAVVALKPLHDQFKMKRIVYSTYQAVSGSGVGGLESLDDGEKNIYPHEINGNVLPHIDQFLDNGYTKEEMKMVEETRKIFSDENLKVTATCVRVPVRYGHSLSINVEFENPFTLEQVYKALGEGQGIELKDHWAREYFAKAHSGKDHGNKNHEESSQEKNRDVGIEDPLYPMPLDAEGKDLVYVGRIRRDYSVENGLNLWVVADNIRKGAALNAVQIVESLINRREERLE